MTQAIRGQSRGGGARCLIGVNLRSGRFVEWLLRNACRTCQPGVSLKWVSCAFCHPCRRPLINRFPASDQGIWSPPITSLLGEVSGFAWGRKMFACKSVLRPPSLYRYCKGSFSHSRVNPCRSLHSLSTTGHGSGFYVSPPPMCSGGFRAMIMLVTEGIGYPDNFKTGLYTSQV